MKTIFVYITNPSKEEAVKLARHLLEKKLIACANIFPITSVYRWEGKIAEEGEFVLIGKTFEEKFEKVKTEVEKIHPYKIPCITKIPVEPNKKYLDWLEGEIKISL